MFINKLSQDNINKSFATACSNGELEIVKDLYERFKPKKSPFQYFFTLTRLKQSLDIHYKDDTPFVNACIGGHKHIVEFFLSNDEFMQQIKKTSVIAIGLRFAIPNNNLDIVRLILPLLKKNRTAYNLVSTGFEQACSNGSLNTIKYLTTNKAFNLDEFDEKFYSELSYSMKYEGFIRACENNQLAVVQFLTNPKEIEHPINLDKIGSVIKITDARIIQHFIYEMNVTKQDSIMMRLNTDDEITNQINYFIEKKKLLDTIKEELGVNKASSSSKIKI